MRRTRPMADRFWEKVDKRGPDECWPWLSTHNRKGYGRFWATDTHDDRPAHAVAWELEHGTPFPAGMMALHHCDNPPCVNPSHIFPGTARDNAHDAIAKGRFYRPPLQATCNRGHEYTDENTRYQQLPTRAQRVCRICEAARNVKAKRRQKLRRWGAA